VKFQPIRVYIARTALVAAIASFGIAALTLTSSAGSASAQGCVGRCTSPAPVVAPGEVSADKPTKAPSKTATVTESLSLSFTKVEVQY